MLRLKGGSYPLNRSNVEKHDHFGATGKVYLANSSVASPWKMLKGSKFDRGVQKEGGGCSVPLSRALLSSTAKCILVSLIINGASVVSTCRAPT